MPLALQVMNFCCILSAQVFIDLYNNRSTILSMVARFLMSSSMACLLGSLYLANDGFSCHLRVTFPNDIKNSHMTSTSDCLSNNKDFSCKDWVIPNS